MLHLTLESGRTVTLAVKHIVAILPECEGTDLTGVQTSSGLFYYVKETSEEIGKMRSWEQLFRP